jgi:hypothetical protein
LRPAPAWSLGARQGCARPAEGVKVLGFVEALPREARRELLEAIRETCRQQGYLSLHDDLRAHFAAERERPRMAKVIPFRR